MALHQINKGDRFNCIKDYPRYSDAIFLKDNIYKSLSDNSITDNDGNKWLGWDAKVFNAHFEQLPKSRFRIIIPAIFNILALAIITPIVLTGVLIHYLSKITMLISYVLMFKTQSAKNLIKKFLTIKSSLGDLF